MKIYVGYDSREHVAFQTLEHNLKQWGHEVIPINHRNLRRAGKFNREWIIQSDGQFMDGRDRKPFSTEFSHTRFAAITMAREAGITDWCMFVDCDFMFFKDPAKLLTIPGTSHDKAIACVQFVWNEPEGLKMDGMVQLLYHRKLWSSLFLFQPQHPAHAWLTWHKINWETGAALHAFTWVADECIGRLPPSWNYIPNFSNPDPEPDAVHWSYGGPWFDDFKDTEFAGNWRDAYKSAMLELT